MGLYLEVTCWTSGKEHALGERGRDIKLGLRKCFQADVGRREATKTTNFKQLRHSLEAIFQFLYFKGFSLVRTVVYRQEA